MKKLQIFYHGTIFILLLMLIFMGYRLFLQNSQLNEKLIHNNDFINSISLKVYNNKSYLDNELINYNHQIESLNNKLNSLNNININLLQLNELINMANQSLIIYHDSQSAIKLLKYAYSIIANNTDNKYTILKYNLLKDISLLNNQEQTNFLLISAKLNAIFDIINDLSLVSDTFQSPSNNSKPIDINYITNNHNSWWQKTIDYSQYLFLKIYHCAAYQIKQLFTVSYIENKNVALMMPKDEILIKQNLKINLLNMRLALLEHNVYLWQVSITNFKNGLNKYFTPNQSITNINTDLDLFLTTKINIEYNLNDTIAAMDKILNENK